MAKHQFWNIGKANAEISSAHDKADAALTAAKITTLKVDGKDIPAADAPLAVKIEAVAAIAASGEKSQDVSELIASNGQLATSMEKVEGDLTREKATSSALSQENSRLKTELATAQASVQTLTAEAATNKNLLEASNKENGRLTSQYNAVNTEVSQLCLEYGCLDLTGEDGKPLAKDASSEQRLAAANRISITDKLKASKGAVNAAMAKQGLSFAQVPAGGAPSTEKKTELKGRERMKSSMKIEGQPIK